MEKSLPEINVFTAHPQATAIIKDPVPDDSRINVERYFLLDEEIKAKRQVRGLIIGKCTFTRMKTRIEPLINQDQIRILAPAKAIEKAHVLFAKEYLETHGFRVQISKYCLGEYHYFSGNEEQRMRDFQEALDDPDVKAILCARGGYGCIQIIDRIRWASQLTSPKWIIGFSDITVFHQKMQRLNGQSIHATMPLNFSSNTEEALTTLTQALKGTPMPVRGTPSSFNQPGTTSGRLVGGNLSVIYSFLGTDDQPNYRNGILFIEDLSEHIYHIDRMLHAFSKAHVLSSINGLIVGGMTNLKDTHVPFGKSYEEVILSHFQFHKIPIAFDFPAGHIPDNRALILGASVQLTVDDRGSSLEYC